MWYESPCAKHLLHIPHPSLLPYLFRWNANIQFVNQVQWNYRIIGSTTYPNRGREHVNKSTRGHVQLDCPWASSMLLDQSCRVLRGTGAWIVLHQAQLFCDTAAQVFSAHSVQTSSIKVLPQPRASTGSPLVCLTHDERIHVTLSMV